MSHFKSNSIPGVRPFVSLFVRPFFDSKRQHNQCVAHVLLWCGVQ